MSLDLPKLPRTAPSVYVLPFLQGALNARALELDEMT